MAIKLVLSSEEISNKVFKGVPRGYDPYEVDKYLDQIIMDYERVEANFLMSKQEIEELNAKIKKLEEDKHYFEIELGRIKTKYTNVKPGDAVNDDNIKLIKRINALETFLWQNGFNPNNIK